MGLAVAAVIRWVRTHLDDPLIETALSLATPFLAYLPAEALHASGVLAVVMAGLWLGHSAPLLLSGPSRLQSRAVWRLVAFLLEGFVFLLIGNQLPAVIRGLRAYPTHTVVLAATVSVAAVLLVRPIWLYLTSHLPGRLYVGASSLSGPELLALSWAGTRGVISLAAVFALPLTTGREPLAHRDLLLFCAYVVVLATLVGQGLTFAPLLSRLRGRAAARVAAADAALERLDELRATEHVSDDIVGTLRTFAENRRLHGEERLRQLEDPSENGETTLGTSARLRREMIDAEREELVRWRDAGRLAETDLRDLERQLDHEEGRLPP